MQRANSISSSSSRMMLRRPSTKIPTSDPDIDSPSGRSRSSRLQHNISCLSNEEESENNNAESTPTGGEEGDEEEAAEGGEEEEGGGPVRMSLMALLAETDRQMGVEGSAYMMGDEEEEEEEEEEENEEENVEEEGEYSNCCVCMVRHKGTANTPCAHTFCKLCSRELYVQKGNCPLCNGYVMEILEIF